MQLEIRSPPRLARAVRDGFIWATGIEDTFIATPHPSTGRILDEYLLTEHYDKWREDIDLIAELGVRHARYGIPWHRVNPARGVYDWEWTDKVLEYMVRQRGIEPIIDLVHYGTPLWLEESFFNPYYPELVSEYARAFAEHYRGLCYWYTPLNEPRINAWYCGRISRWPPYGSGWKGFTRVLLQIARGVCLTQAAILEAEPEAVMVHVDASDQYFTRSEDEALRTKVDLRQSIVYLALELELGRVVPGHPLYSWIKTQGATEAEMVWFNEHKLVPHVIGFNMYPMFSLKEILLDKQGRLDIRMRPCGVETLCEIARGYNHRFPEFPLMITETADKGSAARRSEWIEKSTAMCLEARDMGFPIIGYTFWPLFSLYNWSYQTGSADADKYLLHIGLWDLKRGPNGLERRRTRAVDTYKKVMEAERAKKSTPDGPTPSPGAAA